MTEKTEKFDFDSTFSKFFGADFFGADTESGKACKECGTTENLEVWYRAHNDEPVYRCQTCREKYEAEQAASEEAHHRQMDEIIWRNDWEE